MNSILISVIIPVYNTENYLNKCVESVINQTYKNLEIILVDDGSPDNCPAMCDEWAKKDNRIKVIHKENGGVSSARNAGLNVVQGEYINFVDSDDWIDNDCLETLLNELVSNSCDIAICNFYYNEVDGSEKKIISEKQIYESDILKQYLLDNIRPDACGKLFSSRMIDINTRFDNKYSYGEDMLFNYYIFKNSKKVVNIGDAKYHYLQNNGISSTSAYMTVARAESWKITKVFVLDNINTNLFVVSVWRHVRTLLAIMNRIASASDTSFFDKYYSIIFKELKNYKKYILTNPIFTKKQKLNYFILNFKNIYKFYIRHRFIM